ncbi:hypothetical protein IEQ34_017892 [Dendrobium chrysotoxum]|uniref:Uncharacterized protein n=1 Tax=Dendrobium chrysotoxum TaxID=161865 RepID=A0AAV7GCW1_DENCH|nr:hypothetical protein IEQ34_017892 [Dendrobium chrysotoxum]
MMLVKNIFELRANTLYRALHLRGTFVSSVTKTTLISANAVFRRGIHACVERCRKSKLVHSITRHPFKTIISDPDSVLHSLTRLAKKYGSWARCNADFCEDVAFMMLKIENFAS